MSKLLDPSNLQADYDISHVALFDPALSRVLEKSNSSRPVTLKGYELLDRIVKASAMVDNLQQAINNAIVLYEKGPME